jgi:hypothetical protein
MWCSECERITTCKAVSPREVNPELSSARRWRYETHTDVQWFRRGRICLECDNEFVTAETREDFISELVELRDALGEIKKNAEKYIRESESASKSLKKLSGSLAVLRALHVYQSQETDEDYEFEGDDDDWDEDDDE